MPRHKAIFARSLVRGTAKLTAEINRFYTAFTIIFFKALFILCLRVIFWEIA